MTPSLADQSPASLPKVGSKRSPSPVSDDQRPPTTKMSKIKKDEEDQEEDDDEIPKQEKVQRIKLPPEPRHHHTHTRHEVCIWSPWQRVNGCHGNTTLLYFYHLFSWEEHATRT